MGGNGRGGSFIEVSAVQPVVHGGRARRIGSQHQHHGKDAEEGRKKGGEDMRRFPWPPSAKRALDHLVRDHG